MCDAVRFLPLLLLAVAASPHAHAQGRGPTAHGPPAFEITPFIGYRTGGDFEGATTGEEIDLGDSRTFAIAFNLRIDEGSQYELFYSRQDSELERSSSLAGVHVDVEYFHIGGTLVVDDVQRWRPYIVGTVGATRFSPEPPEADDETKVSISLGGGLRVPVSERFSLRLEARGYLTFVDTDSALFCESGSFGGVCQLTGNGSTFIQYEALLGAAVAF